MYLDTKNRGLRTDAKWEGLLGMIHLSLIMVLNFGGGKYIERGTLRLTSHKLAGKVEIAGLGELILDLKHDGLPRESVVDFVNHDFDPNYLHPLTPAILQDATTYTDQIAIHQYGELLSINYSAPFELTWNSLRNGFCRIRLQHYRVEIDMN